MSDIKRLVIIPTYNEKENVEAIIRAVFGLSMPFDILIVDDNSPDGTAGIVKHLSQEYPQQLHILERPGKQGLGTAYIAGFQWALKNNYDHICEMDADFSHNPNDLILLSQACTDGVDFAIGSRYAVGVNVVNWPMSRVLMSWGASKYVKCATGIPINDTTAGFICYTSNVLKAIDLNNIRMKGYGFQIEMKYTAWKLNFSFKEVSIIFIDRKRGSSKMSGGIFSEAFWGVLKLRFKKIRF